MHIPRYLYRQLNTPYFFTDRPSITSLGGLVWRTGMAWGYLSCSTWSFLQKRALWACTTHRCHPADPMLEAGQDALQWSPHTTRQLQPIYHMRTHPRKVLLSSQKVTLGCVVLLLQEKDTIIKCKYFLADSGQVKRITGNRPWICLRTKMYKTQKFVGTWKFTLCLNAFPLLLTVPLFKFRNQKTLYLDAEKNKQLGWPASKLILHMVAENLLKRPYCTTPKFKILWWLPAS